MNKYAIYTEGDVYPVLEKDGQYYIGIPNTGHFSGDWKFLGVRERLKNSRTIIKPEEALKITDWKFKNGSPRYQVVDLDHGTVRTWAGTSPNQQLRSFDTISDSGFELATKTDNDEEIVLEESKKYAIYATYGGDGVYNSKLVDTVDSEEQAVDRVAELQAMGLGASYEEVENKKENKEDDFVVDIDPDKLDKFRQEHPICEYCGKRLTSEEIKQFGVNSVGNGQCFDCYYNDDLMLEDASQASGVASGVNGKIDSFPIDPKEMEKQRLKEDTDNPYFVIEDIGAAYLMAGPFKNKEDAESEKNKLITKYNLEDEEDIIHVWDWKTIKEFEDNVYDTYQEFINAGDSAPYYKEIKLTESISNLKVKNYVAENTGGNTIVYMGQFEDGNYFRLGDENLVIFDDDYHQAYLDELTAGETDWEEVHMIDSYYYDSDEYKQVYNQIHSKGLNESDIFNAREELIDYLNENTKYEWDANESYDNCAITESETDYIEVFVDIKDGNKIYTVDNYSYNSLEELIKNMPVLFTDEDEDYDYDSNWEDLDESKDLTKTLHEMALLEDYEDDISPQKKKFIEFCKDKIKDLGDIEIYDETAEENVQYHKIMHTEGIREFNDLYIVANFEEYDENLKAINSENKMVIDTPMIDCNGYAATMQFDEIDQEYYHTLLEYWNDLYMDEIIDDEEE